MPTLVMSPPQRNFISIPQDEATCVILQKTSSDYTPEMVVSLPSNPLFVISDPVFQRDWLLRSSAGLLRLPGFTSEEVRVPTGLVTTIFRRIAQVTRVHQRRVISPNPLFVSPDPISQRGWLPRSSTGLLRLPGFTSEEVFPNGAGYHDLPQDCSGYQGSPAKRLPGFTSEEVRVEFRVRIPLNVSVISPNPLFVISDPISQRGWLPRPSTGLLRLPGFTSEERYRPTPFSSALTLFPTGTGYHDLLQDCSEISPNPLFVSPHTVSQQGWLPRSSTGLLRLAGFTSALTLFPNKAGYHDLPQDCSVISESPLNVSVISSNPLFVICDPISQRGWLPRSSTGLLRLPGFTSEERYRPTPFSSALTLFPTGTGYHDLLSEISPNPLFVSPDPVSHRDWLPRSSTGLLRLTFQRYRPTPFSSALTLFPTGTGYHDLPQDCSGYQGSPAKSDVVFLDFGQRGLFFLAWGVGCELRLVLRLWLYKFFGYQTSSTGFLRLLGFTSEEARVELRVESENLLLTFQ
ncbi:hypothetical protein QE152_g32201 [Popillia japonica]|uniref:Uncharacterized protein n=1 Tax=Popillia japonica TaxID=7064 RepID=A0AAW1J028_POPJA